jgi:hypothetical protein
MLGLYGHEQVIGTRGAVCGDTPAAKVGECAKAVAISLTNGQNLAKLVVRNGDREARAACGAVFDAAQADVEVSSRSRRVKARESNLDESRHAGMPGRKFSDLDVEADYTGSRGRPR